MRIVTLRSVPWFPVLTCGTRPLEPGAEAAASFERGQPGQHLDEHLLRGILGVLRVIEHAAGDVVDLCGGGGLGDT
jgi:hypothetical protein